MEDVKDKKELKKTLVFNVIILDRSGSMECIRRAGNGWFQRDLDRNREGAGDTAPNLKQHLKSQA